MPHVPAITSPESSEPVDEDFFMSFDTIADPSARMRFRTIIQSTISPQATHRHPRTLSYSLLAPANEEIHRTHEAMATMTRHPIIAPVKTGTALLCGMRLIPYPSIARPLLCAARGHLYRRRAQFRQEHFNDLREFHRLDHKTASPLAKHDLRHVSVGLTRNSDRRHTRTDRSGS